MSGTRSPGGSACLGLPKNRQKLCRRLLPHPRLTRRPRWSSRVAGGANDTMLSTHSIQIGGRTIDVRMEEEFWDCLRDIAANESTTLAAHLKRIVAESDPKAD